MGVKLSQHAPYNVAQHYALRLRRVPLVIHQLIGVTATMMGKNALILAAGLLLGGCSLVPYNASIYKGINMAEPTRDDEGRLVYSGGLSYLGDLEQGRPHGQGELKFANGDIYQGGFENGLASGQGQMRYADGRVYSGQFQYDAPRGEGQLTLANGDIQRGVFANLSSFKGEWVTTKGSLTGEFSGGVRDGELLFQPAGSKVDRFQIWENDQLLYDAPGPKAFAAGQKRCRTVHKDWAIVSKSCNGKGEAVHKSFLTVAKGRFSNGDLVSGTIESRGGLKYEGAMRRFAPHGKAQHFQNGKKLYDGGFASGQRHGGGICLEGGKPERCEYVKGQRADSGYLSRLFRKDMDELQSDYDQSLARIKEQTRDKQREWREDYQRKMRHIEKQIDRAEQAAVAKSMALGTIQIMGGDEAGARAYIEEQGRIARERKAELRQMERNFNREQAEAKKRFAKWQQEKVDNLSSEHQAKVKSLVDKHRSRCLSFPARSWQRSKNLCAKTSNYSQLSH